MPLEIPVYGEGNHAPLEGPGSSFDKDSDGSLSKASVVALMNPNNLATYFDTKVVMCAVLTLPS